MPGNKGKVSFTLLWVFMVALLIATIGITGSPPSTKKRAHRYVYVDLHGRQTIRFSPLISTPQAPQGSSESVGDQTDVQMCAAYSQLDGGNSGIGCQCNPCMCTNCPWHSGGTTVSPTSGDPTSGTTVSPTSGSDPTAGTTGSPTTGTTSYPTTSTTGYPTTGSTGYPTTGSTGYPTTGSTGYPTTGSTGYPTTGSTGYPTTGGTGTTVSTTTGSTVSTTGSTVTTTGTTVSSTTGTTVSTTTGTTVSTTTGTTVITTGSDGGGTTGGGGGPYIVRKPCLGSDLALWGTTINTSNPSQYSYIKVSWWGKTNDVGFAPGFATVERNMNTGATLFADSRRLAYLDETYYEVHLPVFSVPMNVTVYAQCNQSCSPLGGTEVLARDFSAVLVR